MKTFVTFLVSRSVRCEVVPRLIPFGMDEDEQYEILDVIAKNVPEGTVNFDLTHGFRHFGHEEVQELTAHAPKWQLGLL